MRKIEEKVPFIGYILKEQRALLGMTQKELSEKVGVSLKVIRNLEQGYLSVTLKAANELFHFFGLELTPQKLSSQYRYKTKEELTTEVILSKLSRALPIIKKKLGVKKLSLFGSFSTGHQTETSDVDILISDKKELSLDERVELISMLEFLFYGREIDIVHKSRLNPLLKERILYEAIPIKEIKRSSSLSSKNS